MTLVFAIPLCALAPVSPWAASQLHTCSNNKIWTRFDGKSQAHNKKPAGLYTQIVRRQSVINRGVGITNSATSSVRSQRAKSNSSNDLGGLVVNLLCAMAAKSSCERDVMSPSSHCRFTAHAGLGLTARIPLPQSQPGSPAEFIQVKPVRQIEVGKIKMNNANTKTGATPTANVVKQTVFTIKTRPIIAPKGLQQATWGGVVNEVGNGVNRLVATVELEATDPQAKHFTLTEAYSLLPNARGAKAFLQDYNSWTGAGLTEDDLYESFDGTKDVGKALVVEVDHRKVGKEWEAHIVSFHPAGATELGVAP